MVLVQQRNREHRAIANPDQHILARALVTLVEDIGDLSRLTRDRHAADRAIALTNWHAANRVEQLLRLTVGSLKPEYFVRLVVLVDRPAVEPSELQRMRHDRLQHVSRSSVELTARPTSPRAVSWPTRCSNYLEQAHVLDRDHGLVGKGPHK
jgi:hypothetical protein